MNEFPTVPAPNTDPVDQPMEKGDKHRVIPHPGEVPLPKKIRLPRPEESEEKTDQ